MAMVISGKDATVLKQYRLVQMQNVERNLSVESWLSKHITLTPSPHTHTFKLGTTEYIEMK